LYSIEKEGEAVYVRFNSLRELESEQVEGKGNDKKVGSLIRGKETRL